MKTKQQKLPQPKCPYLRSDDCGRPDKYRHPICNDTTYCNYKACISYQSITQALKDLEEYEKDGKQKA